jgi:hypothetical protein
VYGDARVSGNAQVSGGKIGGSTVEIICAFLQYHITINLTCDSAQIGCHYKTIADWLNVSLDDAKEMGLRKKNFEPIRELLKRFAK